MSFVVNPIICDDANIIIFDVDIAINWMVDIIISIVENASIWDDDKADMLYVVIPIIWLVVR